MRLSRYILIFVICAGFTIVMAAVQGAHAACESVALGGSCDNGDSWNPTQKLDEIGNPQTTQSQDANANWPERSRMIRWNEPAQGFENKNNNSTKDNNAETSASSGASRNTKQAQRIMPVKSTPVTSENENHTLQRSSESNRWLASLDDVSSTDILLDVSENSTRHIRGSVVIPYMNLWYEPGRPKSVEEIAKILGDAGISPNDSIVIYGECLPCGGGPSLATYVYWIMELMGHKNVRVLDGMVEDWAAAGKPTVNETDIRSSKIYTPEYTTDAIATYDYVKSGQAQIVDARTTEEYGSGSISGAIPIPYENVLDGKRIKSEAALKRTFAILSKDRPVVVYTDTGLKASVVWFALDMMGYDAKIYTWQDWLANQPRSGNINNTTA